MHLDGYSIGWAIAAFVVPIVGCAGFALSFQGSVDATLIALLCALALQLVAAAAAVVESARGRLPSWVPALHVSTMALPWAAVAIAASPFWFIAMPAGVLAVALLSLGSTPLSEVAAGQALLEAWHNRPALDGSYRRRTLFAWIGTLVQVPLVIPVAIGILGAGFLGPLLVGGGGPAGALVGLVAGLAGAIGFLVLGVVPLTISFFALAFGLTRPHYVRWLARGEGEQIGKRTGTMGLALDAVAWFLFAGCAIIAGMTALLGPFGIAATPLLLPLFILTAIRWHYYAAVAATDSGHFHGFVALGRLAIRHPRQLYISTVLQGTVLVLTMTVLTVCCSVAFGYAYAAIEAQQLAPIVAFIGGVLASILLLAPLGWLVAPVLAGISSYRLAVVRRLPLTEMMNEERRQTPITAVVEVKDDAGNDAP